MYAEDDTGTVLPDTQSQVTNAPALTVAFINCFRMYETSPMQADTVGTKCVGIGQLAFVGRCACRACNRALHKEAKPATD